MIILQISLIVLALFSLFILTYKDVHIIVKEIKEKPDNSSFIILNEAFIENFKNSGMKEDEAKEFASKLTECYIAASKISNYRGGF